MRLLHRDSHDDEPSSRPAAGAPARANTARKTEETPGELDERRAKAAEADAARDQERDAPNDPNPPAENVSDTGRRDYAPHGRNTDTGAWATVKRTIAEFREASLTDQAASLTYYGLLSLFPGLIALVSILGLFGDPAATTRTLTDVINNLAPGSAAQTFSGPIESITSSQGTAGVMFIVGIATAIWSASGYIGAYMRAANVIYETPEGRPFWKLRPLQLAVTLVMILLLCGLLLGLVFTGPVVDAVAGPLGLSDTAVTIWNIAKWPVMVAVAIVMLAVLFYASPNVKLPRFKLITPGAVAALAIWLVASVAFAFYVANFGSYDKTYGTLGGAISLLVWMWISNIALLLGTQLNAELERNRELNAGIDDAARELQLDARDEPNERATT